MKIAFKNVLFYSDSNVINHAEQHPILADLYVYITYQAEGGVVGKAPLGSICNPDSGRKRRTSVNAHFGGDQGTGEVSSNSTTHKCCNR